MKVYLVAANTICGRISPVGMGSPHDRHFLEKLRSQTDASLLGAGTLREADPEMRTLSGKLPRERLRCLITASGDIPSFGKKLFACKPAPIIFTHSSQCDRLQRIFGSKAQVVGIASMVNNQLSLSAAVNWLKKKGVETLLIEGGGQLNYSALQEQVIDEIFLTLTPYLNGNVNQSSLADGLHDLGSPYIPLELISCKTAENGELFLHYRINKELYDG